MKYDLSDRSHDLIIPEPGSPVRRALINLSGISANLAYKFGSAQERGDLATAGALLVGSSCLSGATATAGIHLALGDGSFNFWYALAGVGIGALTGLNDYLIQYKGTISERGRSALRRAGFKLPESDGSQAGPRFVRLVRVLQAGAFGFLGGLFFLIAANRADIKNYLAHQHLVANQAAVADATKTVDAGIARSRQALQQQDNEVENVGRSVQSIRSNDVRRMNSRRANTTAVGNAQLGVFEQRRADEITKRDNLMAAVSAQELGRTAAIEKLTASGSNAMPKRSGLLAEAEALTALSSENPKMLAILLAIELLSLCLELGPLWAAASRIPSALAARIALDNFIEVSEVAQDAAKRLGAHPIALRVSANIAKAPTAESDPIEPHAATNLPATSDRPVSQTVEAPRTGGSAQLSDIGEQDQLSLAPQQPAAGTPTPEQQSIADALGLRTRRRAPSASAKSANGVDGGHHD